MDALIEQKQQILNRITHLQELQRYFISDYDYHHLNNEMLIIEEKLQILKESEQVFGEFINGLNDIKDLTAKAKMLCDRVDEMPQFNDENKENCGNNSD